MKTIRQLAILATTALVTTVTLAAPPKEIKLDYAYYAPTS